jgi:hypothetical protein
MFTARCRHHRGAAYQIETDRALARPAASRKALMPTIDPKRPDLGEP